MAFDLDLSYSEDKRHIQEIMIENKLDYDAAYKFDFEKKRIALDVLKMDIDKIIMGEDWTKKSFDIPYERVIECNYINQWIWKRPMKSPTKSFSAEVFCEHNLRSFDISIVIKTHNGEE